MKTAIKRCSACGLSYFQSGAADAGTDCFAWVPHARRQKPHERQFFLLAFAATLYIGCVNNLDTVISVLRPHRTDLSFLAVPDSL